MSDFLDEVAADCAEAENDLGLPVMVWNSQSITCAATLTKRGAVLVIGGKEVEIALTLRVRWSGTNAAGREWEFTTAENGMPKAGERVNYKGKNYRIAAVNDAHGAFLEIDLIDVNR